MLAATPAPPTQPIVPQILIAARLNHRLLKQIFRVSDMTRFTSSTRGTRPPLLITAKTWSAHCVFR
eukprot:6116767-Prymnesium_polylepis.1